MIRLVLERLVRAIITTVEITLNDAISSLLYYPTKAGPSPLSFIRDEGVGTATRNVSDSTDPANHEVALHVTGSIDSHTELLPKTGTHPPVGIVVHRSMRLVG